MVGDSIQIILTVMWGQRKGKEQNWGNTSTSLHRNIQQQMTPRQKQKPNVPLPNRNNLTPSRIEQRYTSSPLRLPLENAINKITRDKSTERQSKSRVLNKSSRRQDSSILRRGLFEEEQTLQNKRKAHEETVIFIKKYFDFDNYIPINQFIDRLLKQYETLWEKFNINQIIDQFTEEIYQIFGTDNIEPKDLIRVTKQNGMLGLILHIFKLISNEGEETRGNGSYVVFSKSPNVMSINKSFENQLNECVNLQHLKNIIQQFMELMYKEMENEIYNKFNVEMRRMILKGREADKILKKVQEKLVMNADYFESEKRWERQIKMQEETIQELKKKVEKYQTELKREKQYSIELKSSKAKYQEQNTKLKQNLERYQNIIFNKFQNLSSLPSESAIQMQPTLSRKLTSTPLLDRTQEFNNQNTSIMNDSKPFQIQIDTHFIQRDSGPPITQTTTTFTDQNFQPRPLPSYPMSNVQNTYSPIKFNSDIFDSNRPSFEGGSRPMPKINEYTYSPLQSRLSRPF